MASDATSPGDIRLQPGPAVRAFRDASLVFPADEPSSHEVARLYTPEEAAAILSGHRAPFSARAGDVTPGGLRAAAHRREIPFRLWRGKVRFTGEDLRTAVLQAAVSALPAPAEASVPCVRRTRATHPPRRRSASAARDIPPQHGPGTRRRLVARTPGHGGGSAAGEH
jgi:hypothetical protein